MSDRTRRRQQSESQRRRFPRWQVPNGRLVGPVVVARVLDLGPAGAHIETTKALRVGASYPFTLELEGSSRRLDGLVRWCRLIATREADAGERTPVYRAGVVWGPRHLHRGRQSDR